MQAEHVQAGSRQGLGDRLVPGGARQPELGVDRAGGIIGVGMRVDARR